MVGVRGPSYQEAMQCLSCSVQIAKGNGMTGKEGAEWNAFQEKNLIDV